MLIITQSEKHNVTWDFSSSSSSSDWCWSWFFFMCIPSMIRISQFSDSLSFLCFDLITILGNMVILFHWKLSIILPLHSEQDRKYLPLYAFHQSCRTEAYKHQLCPSIFVYVLLVLLFLRWILLKIFRLFDLSIVNCFAVFCIVKQFILQSIAFCNSSHLSFPPPLFLDRTIWLSTLQRAFPFLVSWFRIQKAHLHSLSPLQPGVLCSLIYYYKF